MNNILFYFQAFEAIEEAVRIVNCEIERTKEKVKKDTENMTDSQEFIKVYLFTNYKLYYQGILVTKNF